MVFLTSGLFLVSSEVPLATVNITVLAHFEFDLCFVDWGRGTDNISAFPIHHSKHPK